MTHRQAQYLGLSLLSPLLSVGLLAGIAYDNSKHLTPTDVEPFHAKAKQAVLSISPLIDMWTGKDEPVPPAAVKLLNNPVIISRTYIDNSIGKRRDRRASLLVVQCRE